MVVLSFVFGHLAQLDAGGVPYPILTFAALIPWNFFSKACQLASGSLEVELPVITKVYFPRMIVVVSAVVSRIVDLAASLLVFVVLMLVYHVTPGIAVLALPLYTLLAIATALAISLWTASLTVRYRDVRYVVEYGVQGAMFLTPVAYSGEVMARSIPHWLWLYKLNPMYWVVEGFRWGLLGTGEPPRPYMLYSIALVLALLVSGGYVFRRTERTVVDFL
jgi:lipopolysaccharide transport system permease protein